MTTPTPTSSAGVLPLRAQESGNLDPGLLQNLANTFFKAHPGEASIPSSSRVASSSVQPVTPSLQPAVPVSAPRESAATAGRAQNVPEAYAAALPFVEVPRGSSGASYYFLDPELKNPGEDPLHSLTQQALNPDRVTAQPFALPGQDELKGLLGEIQHPGNGTPGENPASETRFSFLDENVALHDPRLDQKSLGIPASSLLDVHAIRKDFPILSERVNGRPLIWFDNAATTQKPQAVIDRIAWFYEHENSNIHRAAHELAARATDAYESARQKTAEFLGARSAQEIVFVRGATEAINLVARTFGVQEIGEGDEIILSHLEHHANIVPWQQLAREKGAKLRVIPVDDHGQVRLDEYARLLNPRTRLVSVAQVSNALGTVLPVSEIIAMAHAVGAKVLVDGAQAVSHMRVNVQALDADFYVFSGHKIFGPTGIGAVYGKKEILDQLPPWQGGGNMIADVTFEQTVYQGAPMRFEAGTGNIADAVGLGAALDYVRKIGQERIAQYEHLLLEYATERLRPIPGVRIIGTAPDKASVLSFVLKGYKTEEVGEALNREGIAVRSGHHCAQPILRRFGVEATVRPSLAFYNTCEEVDVFINVIRNLASRKK